jgi:hypothetical protein
VADPWSDTAGPSNHRCKLCHNILYATSHTTIEAIYMKAGPELVYRVATCLQDLTLPPRHGPKPSSSHAMYSQFRHSSASKLHITGRHWHHKHDLDLQRLPARLNSSTSATMATKHILHTNKYNTVRPGSRVTPSIQPEHWMYQQITDVSRALGYSNTPAERFATSGSLLSAASLTTRSRDESADCVSKTH